MRNGTETAGGEPRARLPATLAAWGDEAFPTVLKRELASLPSGTLPLDRGAVHGGMVDDSAIAVTLLQATADADGIRLRIGVFFTELVGGCSCGDDPVAENAYCELELQIDPRSAITRFSLP